MFMNVINFLDNATSAGSDVIKIGACDENTLFVFQIARLVIRILQIAVPFALIIWGSLDFFKAVIAGDDKEMKQKRKPFIQRLIAAVIIIVLPIIVNAIIRTLGGGDDPNENTKYNQFKHCWTEADPSNGITLPDAGKSDLED
jgi:hypothetical protein